MVRCRLPSVLGLFLALLVVYLFPSAAFAAEGKVGLSFTGPGAAKVRRNVVQSLPRGLTDDDLKAAEKKAAKPIGKAKGKKRTKAITALGKAGKKAKHAAIVVGTIKKKRVTVVVIDVKGNDVLLDETVSTGDAPATIATALEVVASRYAGSEEPVAAKPEDDEPDEPVADEPSEPSGDDQVAQAGGDDDGGGGGDAVSEEPAASVSGKAAGRSPLIVANAGVIAGGRNLSYTGLNGENNVAEYELFGAFMVDVGLLIQPMRNSTGILGKLGIYANFRTALGLKSQANNDAELATTWYDVQFGLRQRFGGWNKHVAASLGYGIQHFEINDIEPTDLDLYPQSSYGYLRVGIDGRYPLGAKLALIGGGGVRLVLAQEGFNESIGTDKPKAFGFDVGIGATYALGKSLEARIAFDLQRYGTTLSPGASDDNPMTYEADSATEQTLGLGAGIYYAF